MGNISPAEAQAMIQKGLFRPHTALTNMALAYFQNANNYFARAIFPICPVDLSSDIFYRFSKEDLLRDNWQRKPEYGSVMPAVISEDTDTYHCVVDQMIMGISQIRQTDLMRRQGPALARDPRVQRTKTMAEQANIHQDLMFAKKFFKPGVWANEFSGVDSTTPGSKEFIKFSNGNSDPIKFIDDQKSAMHERTGRTPNRIAVGKNVLNALKLHPAIIERVKYGGSTANPASVTEKVLSELFGVEKLVVLNSIYNKAEQGAEAEMSYIGDPNALLLAYATNTPSTDEPSAGYIFTWDMLGNGQYLPIMHRKPDDARHVEEVEGMMATDMKKVADDLAVFCKDVV